MKRTLPGFQAEYIRIEIEHDRAGGFTLQVLLADDPRYVQKSDRHLYGAMPWDELVQVLGEVLDAEGPKELPDGPY